MGSLTTTGSINHNPKGHRETRTPVREITANENRLENRTPESKAPQYAAINTGQASAKKARAKTGVVKQCYGHHTKNGHQQIQREKEIRKKKKKMDKKWVL